MISCPMPKTALKALQSAVFDLFAKSPLWDLPSSENPATVNPMTDKPIPENPTQINTKEVITKKQNTN